MKYQKLCLFAFSLMIILAGLAAAQQPAKIKRPVKNPPQFPNIIDLENKDALPANQPQGAAPAPVQQPDALTSAVLSLAGELRALGHELRAINLREQTQIEMLKMARVDLRIDHYERELRPVRERLGALEADEQTLLQLMTREALLAQTATAATVNREELMRQLRLQHEARYRAVQAEKERLRKLEADLTASLNIYQNLSREAERKIQAAEEVLQQIESAKPEPGSQSQTGQGAKTERKQ